MHPVSQNQPRTADKPRPLPHLLTALLILLMAFSAFAQDETAPPIPRKKLDLPSLTIEATATAPEAPEAPEAPQTAPADPALAPDFPARSEEDSQTAPVPDEQALTPAPATPYTPTTAQHPGLPVRRSSENPGRLRATQLNQGGHDGGLSGEARPVSSLYLPVTDAAAPVKAALFSSTEVTERIRALEAIGAAPDRSDLALILDSLVDPHPDIRNCAAQKAQDLPPQTLIDHIFDTFQYADPLEIERIKGVIGNVREVIEAPLLAILQDPDRGPVDQATAGLALAAIGSSTAAPILMQSVWADNPALAFASAQALYELASPQTQTLWFDLLTHEDPDMISLAMDALNDLGSQDALLALQTVALGAQGHDYDYQLMAIDHILDWPDTMAFPALIEVMVQNRGLRPDVAEALRQRTGLRFGATPLEWQLWYDDYLRRMQGLSPELEGEAMPLE